MTQREGGTDANISAAVRGLIGYRQLKQSDVWTSIGVSKTTWYNKINNIYRWEAEEVALLAEYFQVSITSLYEGEIERPMPGLKRRVSAATRAGVITRQASAGDTHQYVASRRDYRFSRNVTSDQPLRQAA